MGILAIIHEKGFAILSDLNDAYNVVMGNRRVELKIVGSVEEGYVYCCRRYTKRWLDAKKQVPLPTLESLLRAGGCYTNPICSKLLYIAQAVHPDGEPKRFFSVVTPFGFGYFDRGYNVFSLAQQYGEQYLEVQEWSVIEDAREDALNKYIWNQMSLGAYLVGNIEVPVNLKVNEFFSMNNSIMSQLPWNNYLLGV